jgi:hypothetical protein
MFLMELFFSLCNLGHLSEMKDSTVERSGRSVMRGLQYARRGKQPGEERVEDPCKKRRMDWGSRLVQRVFSLHVNVGLGPLCLG